MIHHLRLTYLYPLLTLHVIEAQRRCSAVLDRSPWRMGNDGQANEREATHESSLRRIILGRAFMTAV